MNIKISTPFDDAAIMALTAGQQVLLSGVIYTARDAAHKRLCDLIANKQPLPVDLKGAALYFVGPSPPKPGYVIGSAGPTTSYRMDAYSPILIEHTGLKAMIGKGNRSPEVQKSMQQYRCVYFAATGGAAALIAKSIVKCEVVCYEDLGPEAIHRLEVKDFPLLVAIDCHGNNLYKGEG
ncbi:MAG: Fe-S-containing hydro-lyase [Victivallaceae bacterium]|nr:Fe-S-containing hydro-lyase [Victivallaceae bacterium]MDD4181145.1 Fe-S-containing hydro-lyase [Victivallaceae bacterium]